LARNFDAKHNVTALKSKRDTSTGCNVGTEHAGRAERIFNLKGE